MVNHLFIDSNSKEPTLRSKFYPLSAFVKTPLFPFISSLPIAHSITSSLLVIIYRHSSRSGYPFRLLGNSCVICGHFSLVPYTSRLSPDHSLILIHQYHVILPLSVIPLSIITRTFHISLRVFGRPWPDALDLLG